MKKIFRPSALVMYAIVGYVVFLLLPTRPDLSTFLLFAFGLAGILSKNGDVRPRLAKTDLIVLTLFVVAACVSTLFSEDVARSARYLVYLLTNVFLLLLVSTISSRTQLRVLLGSMVFLGLIHLGAMLMANTAIGPASPEALIGYLPFATLLVPNDMLLLGLCLPAFVYLLWDRHQKWNGTLLSVLATYVLLSLYASYLLQSKMTLMSLLVAVLALFAAWYSTGRGGNQASRVGPQAIMLVPILLLIIGAAWYLGNQSTTRLGLWSYALSSPSGAEVLIGTGPNTFSYDPDVVESSFDQGERVIPWVHNVFLESYTEQGLLGLIGILAMILIPIIRATGLAEPGIRAFLFSSVLTFSLLGMFEITLTRRFCFSFLAIIYGLSCSPALRKPI